jgi:hypothetical protein
LKAHTQIGGEKVNVSYAFAQSGKKTDEKSSDVNKKPDEKPSNKTNKQEQKVSNDANKKEKKGAGNDPSNKKKDKVQSGELFDRMSNGHDTISISC